MVPRKANVESLEDVSPPPLAQDDPEAEQLIKTDSEAEAMDEDEDAGHSNDDSSFPPGQNTPGFVPIGTPGVANAQQGNIAKLDNATKAKIVVAERHAGMAYKPIHTKYAKWDISEERLRGLYRNMARAKEDLERVKSWTLESVSQPHLSILLRELPLKSRVLSY